MDDSFVKLWTILDHILSYLNLLDLFEPIWISLDMFVRGWTFIDPINRYLEIIEAIWSYLELFGAI